MRDNVVKRKSFAFAVEVVRLYKKLCEEHREYVLSKQMLRSGTAVGALIREAEHAESKKDFVHKLAIAQKECNEVLYWLELLKCTDYLDSIAFNRLYDEATQLLKLLTSIIKSSKATMRR